MPVIARLTDPPAPGEQECVRVQEQEHTLLTQISDTLLAIVRVSGAQQRRISAQGTRGGSIHGAVQDGVCSYVTCQRLRHVDGRWQRSTYRLLGPQSRGRHIRSEGHRMPSSAGTTCNGCFRASWTASGHPCRPRSAPTANHRRSASSMYSCLQALCQPGLTTTPRCSVNSVSDERSRQATGEY